MVYDEYARENGFTNKYKSEAFHSKYKWVSILNTKNTCCWRIFDALTFKFMASNHFIKIELYRFLDIYGIILTYVEISDKKFHSNNHHSHEDLTRCVMVHHLVSDRLINQLSSSDIVKDYVCPLISLKTNIVISFKCWGDLPRSRTIYPLTLIPFFY